MNSILYRGESLLWRFSSYRCRNVYSSVWRGRRFSSSAVIREEYLNPTALMQPITQVSTLSNGIRVATTYTPDKSCTFGLWIASGSRYETQQTNGAAHFLEHLYFKGTKKRSRIQLEKEIEHMGSHLNAYTAREQTVYYFKCMKENLPHCAEILSDIILNSKLNQDDLEHEKYVILRELEEVEKSTDEVIFDNLHAIAFRDCSLGFPILGSRANIQNMKRQYLIDYIANNYKADRMVIAAAGDVNHADVVKTAEKYFSSVPTSNVSSFPTSSVSSFPTSSVSSFPTSNVSSFATSNVSSGVSPFSTSSVASNVPSSIPSGVSTNNASKPYFCGSEIIYRNDDMGPTAHVAVAFQGVAWTCADSIAFMVMQSIIGCYNKNEEGIVPGKISGNNTIYRIASKMGVGCADLYSAFNTCYTDTGLFGFYAQCDEIAVEHCIGEIMFGITSMSYSISEEEVYRAKLFLKTQLAASLDSTTAICEDVGRHMLAYGRRIPLAELLARIDAIDAEEIKRVAWKYLHDSEVAVVGLGPLHGMPSYIDIRKMTYWVRY